MLTRPNPPKSGKIVTRPDPTRPDPTRPNPTRGSIRPVDNSGIAISETMCPPNHTSGPRGSNLHPGACSPDDDTKNVRFQRIEKEINH